MIVGLGELVTDHVLEHASGELHISRIRGGGSVWNALVNAAYLGAEVTGFAVAGGDSRGEVAHVDLETLGVDCATTFLARRQTSSVFQLPSSAPSLTTGTGWRLTTSCPVCQRRVPTSRHPSLPTNSTFPGGPESIVLVDRTTRTRAHSSFGHSSRPVPPPSST